MNWFPFHRKIHIKCRIINTTNKRRRHTQVYKDETIYNINMFLLWFIELVWLLGAIEDFATIIISNFVYSGDKRAFGDEINLESLHWHLDWLCV